MLKAMGAVLLLIVTLVPYTGTVAAASTTTPQTLPANWATWAGVAWNYWSSTGGCWNPSTGLTGDSCGWHYFTLWGLASNILGLVAADKIGLVSDFNTRADLILNFLNCVPLQPYCMSFTTGNLPYNAYSSDTGLPSITEPTNPADYGRLLLAEYVLWQHLQVDRLDSTRAAEVESAAHRVTLNAMYSTFYLAADLYGYYATLGYTLWGFQLGLSMSRAGAIYAVQGSSGSTIINVTSRTAAAQYGFQSLMENGPFVSPASMYGVSGIPASTRIDGEPFVDAILEVGDQPLVVGLPSWTDFTGLGQKVYQAQESRSASTGKPEFWTGGGLDFVPGFLSEWIVWITGATWVVLNNAGTRFVDSRVPVAFSKLMFAYNALYDTTYTTNMLNKYAGSLTTAAGFMEGVDATGALDTNVQIQTNQIVLVAAAYVAGHSVPTGTPPPSFTLSCTGGLTGATGATCSFNPTQEPLPFSSLLTISTISSTPLGCYQVTVQATGGGNTTTTKVTLGVVSSSQGVEGMGPYVKNACTQTVSFVLPDYNGPYHTPATKCSYVNAAALSDYSAGGYVLGLLSNPQNQFLDTNSILSQTTTTCVNPTGIGGPIVTLAGPGVNELVHYYEQVADITPVYFLWDGTRNNFVVRSTGVRYTVSAGNTVAGDDLFLIETFADLSIPTKLVFTLYGFSWQGTLAAGVFFSDFMSPQLSQFTNSWYIYEWNDASSGPSHNSFPDPGDSYTFIASSGSAPSPTHTNVPPSGGSYSGFAGIQQDVLGASQDSVAFVLPDYAGPYHSSAAKCKGRSAAALSDYSAGGYLLSATSNFQTQMLDTNSSISSSSGSCGEYSGSSLVLVGMAGPGVNKVVYYYEQVAGITPVYYLWDGSKNNFVVRGAGVSYYVPNSAKNTVAGDDLFLLESFVDGQGRHVYVVYGFSWQGTLAAATYLNTHVRSHLSSFTKSWYIYEWKDASSGLSANSFPDAGDTYSQLASG